RPGSRTRRDVEVVAGSAGRRRRRHHGRRCRTDLGGQGNGRPDGARGTQRFAQLQLEPIQPQRNPFMNTFLDFFWLVLVSFLFLSYLLVLFQIVSDLFRDRELSGWWKALWVVVLVVAPLLGSLVYLIVRGRSMTERSIASTTAARDEVEDYIRSVSGASHSPA